MIQKIQKVVLIDDNAIFRMIFGEIFTKNEKLDMDYACYENALDALAGLKSSYSSHLEYPDYLFVDINMPYIPGWELMDKIKEKDYAFLKNCTIFIISSSSLDSDTQNIHHYPFIKDYILKPVSKRSSWIYLLASP